MYDDNNSDDNNKDDSNDINGASHDILRKTLL